MRPRLIHASIVNYSAFLQNGSSYFIQTCGHVTDVKIGQGSCLFQLNTINYIKNKLSAKMDLVL